MTPDHHTPLTESGWGLILTGGANWGAVQVGAVRALFERGFRPEFIVGVSVGAINGAYLAARPSPDGVEALAEIWEKADARRIFGGRVARLRELAAVLVHDSAFSNRALRSFLAQSLPVSRFEETTIPLAVVASDLASGTSRLLSSGDLLEAILASAAIPGLFPPVTIDGERLVDGAIADPLPVAALLKRGIRRVVVVEAGRPCGCGNDLGHATGLFQRAVTVVMRDRMDLLMRLVPPEVELVSLGLVCHPETPITDLTNAALRVRLGYEEAVYLLDGSDIAH
ncbi:MAG: patatin-like phospholipase family protein [Acidimicrobiia bacterium]|nr:MAG: patatin-like phospholipase family protein [Acidimicrobiia bacterium]